MVLATRYGKKRYLDVTRGPHHRCTVNVSMPAMSPKRSLFSSLGSFLNSRITQRVSTQVGALLFAMVVVSASQTDAWAQVTTAGIRARVSIAGSSEPLPGARVVVTHVPTGSRKEAFANQSGEAAFTGLRVGGPYTIDVFFEGFTHPGYRGVTLLAGKNARIRFQMQVATGEEIIIQGKRVPENSSQRLTFSEKDINNLPSIGRDPKDLVRLSPDAYLEGQNQALSIGGINNRYNSVTIDGIRQDDNFGLNGNGYPTQRSPISLNAIAEIAVERTPFDVRYGQFLGGNINIVTKTGTNEFHGDVLAAYAGDALIGNKASKEELNDLNFNEFRYGFNLGGPIIKDRLHFFVSVEGLEATTPTSVGPVGSGAANEISDITQADVDRVRQVARDTYGFDAGKSSQSLKERDLKLLLKADWAISDQHRLSLTYQRTGGNLVRASRARSGNLPLTSNWFDQRDTLNSFSVKLLSDWTSNLSTHLELSGKIVDARPEPLSGNDFATAEISTADGGTVVIGPDPFRHANQLDNNLLHLKAEANYLLRTHLITGGLEYDRLGIFNLFVPFSNGVAEYDSIDDFESQAPASIFYSNAVTNNPDDGAADWGYGVLSAYVQDQFSITDKLSLQGGLRFEIFQADKSISRNFSFINRYGFGNDKTINGKNILLPRLGVTYQPIDSLNLRSGVGLYSGGTPNVWLSNSYSNNGVSIDSVFSNDPADIAGFDGRTVPTGLTNQLVAGDGNVDALDPDFKIPSSWKFATGLDYSPRLLPFGGTSISLNYVYSRVHNGLQWMDLRRNSTLFDNNTPIGTTVDGRPYYDSDAFNPRRGYDMLLTNTGLGRGHTASVSVTQTFPLGFSLFAAYSHQNVVELSPATSSRSVSNYGQAAVVDPNNPEVARSNYERAHRVIASASYQHPLIADILGHTNGVWRKANSTLGIFLETRSGQPYSYTYGDSARGSALASLFGEEREFARRNRQLFYVPKGDGSDVILDGIDPAEFNQFLAATGLDKYRGEIVSRNAFTSQWISRLDLRLGQEIPTYVGEQKVRLFVDIQNVGNLLNSKWGTVKQVGFPYTVPVVDVAVDPATGRYIYSNLRTEDPERLNVLASLWRIQINAMYSF